ncbi:MAG: cytochrome c3 family protein [Mariniblastus sp.]|nr:cytochrome c3 family protein [Mariniblastus sp.]MDG2181195.1 cytochrome c3 family protein [Mariniblastus sp.]
MQEFHFPNWVNKFTFLAAATAVVVGGYLATCLFAAISPKIVNVGHQPKQPVPFSHKLHAGQLKMDCRYCHNTVERAGHAAIPPTATCGNCHGGSRTTKGERDLGIIRGESTLLKPIRVSLEDNDPVLWERVHDLPDFVYFNHSAHVNKGVSCVTCHGRIDKMEIVTQVKPLSMKWCLDCHRNPTPNIRDPQLVTQLDFVPENPEEYHKKWAEKLNVNPNVNCSTCHR